MKETLSTPGCLTRHSRAVTRNHIEDTGWKIGLLHQVCEELSVEHRFGSGLEHDTAPGQQRRDDLADGEELRHVPRHNRRNHSDRLLENADVVAVQARTCLLPVIAACEITERGEHHQRNPHLRAFGK